MKPIRITATTLVCLAALAGVAQAQTAPRPVPAPVVVQTPAVAPRVVVTPAITNDPVLVELAALDQVRLSLDNLKLTMPEIALNMPVLSTNLADLQVQSKVAAAEAKEIAAKAMADSKIYREVTKDAMETARIALEKSGWDFQEKFSYDFKSSGDYSAGRDLLYRRQYEQAIVRFDKVIAQKGANVDGALYWKAYAQFKLGKTDESLATIATLRKDHGQSRYLQDAKALEADARKMAGKPVNPADVDDEELKLLAISGIQNTDPERAVPLLEGVLNATNSLRVKRRALYILAMSNQPRAYQILLNYAKGGGNPDLQLEAISYLTANRNKQTDAKDLMAIYQTTQDVNVKLAIISALRSSGNSSALSQIVSSGSGTPTLIRTSALNSLAGVMGPQDLWTLYEKETDKDLKLQMVSVFGSMQAMDQLNRIIKTEKDPEVRRRALRSLGNMRSEKTGQMLVDLYGSEQDVDAKKSIISSLGNQNNAEGLVAIARKESSLALKTDIVRKLSEMAPRNKVAADYLMEIIK
jgi:HEAT repeat protein/TolA-binding protein